MENFFIYTIWPLHEAGSSWQDGGCATHNPILPEDYALWTPGMLGASLLAFQRQKA